MMESRDERPVNLSPLHAGADAAHWEAFVRTTIARAERALSERSVTPIDVIASWRTPLLAVAALVVALLIPVELLLERREERVDQIDQLVTLTAEQGMHDALPTGSRIRQALTERVRP